MAQPDVITVDNLPEKLSAWNHNDENHLYAIVDMGRLVMELYCRFLDPANTPTAMGYVSQ